MVLLWMANRNEAFRPFEELFEDKRLAEQTAYRRWREAACILCDTTASCRWRIPSQ